ncbi:MAG: hypothetical protein BME94_05160 [Methanobacteriales archaeon Met13]
MGYGAMTAHWEFAYGPEHFHKLTRQLNYPLLAVNCYQEKNDRLVYAPLHHHLRVEPSDRCYWCGRHHCG